MLRPLSAALSPFVAGLLAFLLGAVPAVAQRVVPPGGRPVVRQGPGPRPAPLSAEFHRGRRAALRARLPVGSVAVLFAAPVRNMAADVDYPYHPDPDFYYLTGLREPGAVLVLFQEPQPAPDGGAPVTELLFVRPRDPQDELWNGARLGPAGAAKTLGFARVYSAAEFGQRCPDLSRFTRVCFLPLPDEGRDRPGDSTELADLARVFRRKAQLPATFDAAREQAYARLRTQAPRQPYQFQRWLGAALNNTPALAIDQHLRRWMTQPDSLKRQAVIAGLPPAGRFDVYALDAALDDLREIKQPEELILLRYAIDVTVAGHRETLRALSAPQSEADLDGIQQHVYRHYGAAATGYAPIVGAGANGCVLHYIENDRPRVGTDLIVMDVGAAYGGYTADVTRTAPGDGSFSGEQRAIYDLVKKAQDAGLAECRPGNRFFAPGEAAKRVIAEGLVRLGIIAHGDSVQRYFPHGTSHYLGLDVHDRGTYGPLRPNSVITVEPGIYIPPGSPCDRKWWGIGCRIEDDVLITSKGNANLSALVPRTAEAIELLIAEPSVLESWPK